ncbi:MAG: hypothetical protein PVI89_15115 [Desulfobacteraceae bacterium]|jgi:hypothetical protein
MSIKRKVLYAPDIPDVFKDLLETSIPSTVSNPAERNALPLSPVPQPASRTTDFGESSVISIEATCSGAS